MSALHSIRRLSVRDADMVLAFLEALDEASVATFHPHAFDLDHVLRLLRGRLAGAVDAFGAFEQARDDLIGYVWLSGMETTRPSLGLCVAGAHRGRGLGRALLERALDEAVLRGRDEVHLSVMPENKPALSLYLSAGFEVVDTVEGKHGHYYCMVLRLDPSPAVRAKVIRKHLAGRDVRVIPYTHCDWAWVHTRHWHAHRYALVFEEVLREMERNADYRWYLDNYACQLRALLELRPDLLPALRMRIAEGRVEVCGAYSNVRPNMVGDETFVRNLVIGRRAFAEALPEATLKAHADAVDVAVGHPQMPQLLRLGGFSYLRMWRPYGALSLKGVPNEFVWRGLDGSEVLAARGCYGGLFSLDGDARALLAPETADPDALLCALWDTDLEVRCRYSETPLAWLSVGCDDVRPNRLIDDTPFDVAGLLRALTANETGGGREHLTPSPLSSERKGVEGFRMRFSTPGEFFAELEQRRGDLRTISGTLDPCDVAYNCAWNGEQGLAVRRMENDRVLVQAETLRALAALGGVAYPDAALDRLWRDHLLTCAHATQWLYAPDFARMRDLADRVRLEGERLRDEGIDALSKMAAHPRDTAFVVANLLPYPRRAIVEATLSRFGDQWPTAFADGDGQFLPAQTIHEHTGQGGYAEKLQAVAVDLPACGLAVLRQVPCAAEPNEETRARPRLDNGRLVVRLREGRITTITDRLTRAALEAPIGLEWAGLVVKEVATAEGPLHVGPIRAERVFEWQRGEFIETGPVRWRYRRRGRAARLKAAMDVVMEAGSQRLDFEVELDWPGIDGFLAVRFPLPLPARMFGDIPFGLEDKDIAAEPYGMDHWVGPHSMERTREGLFYARSFVAVEPPDEAGYALISGNTDRYYLRQVTGRYLEHILINSVATLDDWERQVEPTTLSGRGLHRFRFSLLVLPRGAPTAAIVREAAMVRGPALIREASRGAAAVGTVSSPILSVEPAGVNVTACYREGDETVLRMHEAVGSESDTIVTLPVAPTSARLTDFLGNPTSGDAPRVDGRTVRVRLSPWRIVTLRLTF